MHVQKNTELHFHSHCAERQRIWGVISSLCSVLFLPTLTTKICTGSTFPFDLMNGFILQTQTALLAVLHVASGVLDPPELHRKGFVYQIWSCFQLFRFDFPQNRGASPGQAKAGAVELTQLKVSFNPFMSGI